MFDTTTPYNPMGEWGLSENRAALLFCSSTTTSVVL